ncbi:MAG: hypothetical protein DME09_13040 [Candidatus Rokuibacteriota bacterium]|nr:MAG: hypothetical protein DME09_13040 [Candidatus Rokubacteria bacterium]
MQTRTSLLWAAQAVVLLATLVLGVTPAVAVHNDGIFQVDGDAQTSTCGTAFGGLGCGGDDWDNLYMCVADGVLGCSTNMPGTGNNAAAISDLVVDLSPASIFTGGGSKDQLDITQWSWKNGSVPDKDDLIEAFAALYTPVVGSRAGDKIIYFGASRLAVNGDAQIGFWFLQNAVSLKSDGTFQDSSGGPGHHLPGDILILSNFVQGGGTSNIQVWVVASVNGDGSVTLSQLINGTAGANGVCNPAGTFPADVACAATNGSVIPALDPDFISKSGSGTGQYPVVGFFEGGLDLTDIGLGRECFPTFMVETRSSQSITAVLKDFTIGRFERCAATIRTEIHSAAGDSDPDLQGTSVAPNTTIHDLAIVTGTPGAPAPTGTVTFQLFSSSDCTGVASSQTVALVAGSTDSRSDSGSFTPNPGLLSYQATYNGDSNYPRPLTSLCEPLAVNKFQSSVATHILNASNGSEVTDSLIDLAGAATVAVRDQVIVTKNPAGGDPTPTGTVTVQIFDDGACVHQASLETVTLVGGTCSGSPCGTALSSIVNLDANTLSYRATYSGDGNFLPSTASRCEPVCAIDTTK